MYSRSGHSYSGRGKYLLNCNSVSVIHHQDWIEPHSHLYQPRGPYQNVVFVDREFSDLNSVMQKLLHNDTDAQRIAANSVNTFRDRYLTPAAQTCYWRRLIRAWADVSRFEPQAHVREFTGKDDEPEPERRGVPYESFVADLNDPKA